MVERKKIAGEAGETGVGARGIGEEGRNPPPQSRPVCFSSRLYFSSEQLSLKIFLSIG